MNINVHIERLVLDGIPVPHAQRPLLQTAVESELARLLDADGLAASLIAEGAIPHAPAGTIQLSGGDDPKKIGQRIAQAVYGGIGK
jgi:hypothetical protein